MVRQAKIVHKDNVSFSLQFEENLQRLRQKYFSLGTVIQLQWSYCTAKRFSTHKKNCLNFSK